MTKIILIRNSFDLSHGLPTRYKNFINWLGINGVELYILVQIELNQTNFVYLN